MLKDSVNYPTHFIFISLCHSSKITHFIKWTQTPIQTQIFTKSGPWTFRKDGFCATIHCIFLNIFLPKLRLLISNMTIVFPSSILIIPKLEIFGPNFKDFYFYSKLCSLTNSRVLISNVTIVF